MQWSVARRAVLGIPVDHSYSWEIGIPICPSGILGIPICWATKPALMQNRFRIKTGFASSIEATKLDLAQNGSIQNLFSIKY